MFVCFHQSTGKNNKYDEKSQCLLMGYTEIQCIMLGLRATFFERRLDFMIGLWSKGDKFFTKDRKTWNFLIEIQCFMKYLKNFSEKWGYLLALPGIYKWVQHWNAEIIFWNVLSLIAWRGPARAGQKMNPEGLPAGTRMRPFFFEAPENLEIIRLQISVL
jgi:hypothetical protein